MGFVQTGFLAALGALAIPIVIHLIFRRRTRQVDLGTLHFLKVVLRENARRRKVKRWLLLSLRLACVALLAILFSRPYLIASGLTADKHRFAAVLIDRSASMELQTDNVRLLDLAVEKAKKLIREGGDDLQVEVAFFDQKVHPLGGVEGDSRDRQSTSRSLLDELVSQPASFFATNYGAAMAWARDVCIQSEQPNREIRIFTDLQRSGLDWTTAGSIPRDVEVHVHDLGRSLVNNVAVTSVHTSRSLLRPSEDLSIRVSVFNSGPFPLEKVPVRLEMDDGKQKHLHHENVPLEAGATGSVEFEIAGLGEGFWKGTVDIDVNDELSFDNRRYFGVMAAPRLRVLLIDGEPKNRRLLSETYFLEMALRLAEPGEVYPESPYQPHVVPFTPDGSLPDLGQTDLVVLANVNRLTSENAGRLSRFVQQGGGMLVFTGENVQSNGFRTLETAGLTAGTFSGIQRVEDLPFRLEDWETKHTIFQPFNDPQYGNLRRLSFRAYTKVEPHDGVQVPARFRDGDPALLERPLGKGKILWCTTTCDREWSNWTGSRLYLPLMHQIFGYLSGLAEGGPVREIRIDDADSNSEEIKPGIYERDGFRQVINFSPRESETDRCTVEDFANRFQFPLYENETATVATAGPEIALSTHLRDDEIWHWVILVLIGFLFVESFVANRTAA